MIDTDKIDNMKQWTNDYKVRMFWDLVTEVKRLRKELECWGKMLEIYGVEDERMSAVLSFAFDDGDSSMSYLESILSLSEEDLEWHRETHGGEEE